MNAETNETKTAEETYAETIKRLTRAMMINDKRTVLAGVEEGFGRVNVDLMVDGSLDKRFTMVKMHLELLADHIEEFDQWCTEYTEAVLTPAISTFTADAEGMLNWLLENKSLTPEQRDLVTCQQSRHAVEEGARGCRAAHVRFHELASLAETLAKELETNESLVVHLNPLRLWTSFESPILLDDDETPPVDVLFFAVGRDIRTAVLEPNSRALVEELSEVGPCTIGQWSVVSQHADRDELIEFCRDTAEMQLVAFS